MADITWFLLFALALQLLKGRLVLSESLIRIRNLYPSGSRNIS